MSSQSPRRVIPIKIEPASMLSASDHATVISACARLQHLPGALLPILHAVQRELSYVPRDAIPLIAKELNLSIAEVHGVVTFYHYFLQQRPGQHVVHICRAEACQARGAGALEEHVKVVLGVDYHGTTQDGLFTLEPVFCLGNCALGPSIMIDERLQGRVTAPRFDALIAQARGDAKSAAS